MSELSWLPDWLTHWADRYGNLRTGVPFFVLSFYIALECCGQFRLCRALPNLVWLLAAYVLFALVCGLEAIQFFLPQRSSTLADIAWGSAGILLGGIPLLFFRLYQSIRAEINGET